MDIKPCTIRDLEDIYNIVGETVGYSDELFMSLRSSILLGSTCFLHEGRVLIYESVGKGKYNVHIHSSKSSARGKSLRNFAVKTGRWMLDNKSAKAFINFVPEDRLDIKLFMKMIGSVCMGKIPNTNEFVYVSHPNPDIRE